MAIKTVFRVNISNNVNLKVSIPFQTYNTTLKNSTAININVHVGEILMLPNDSKHTSFTTNFMDSAKSTLGVILKPRWCKGIYTNDSKFSVQ